MWREIKGFEGYEVSSEGQVRSWWRTAGHKRKRRDAPVLMSQCKLSKNSPYLKVTISINGTKHTRAVHHLVIDTFNGPCPDGLWRLHCDGDYCNNRLENLRYDTPAANAADRERHGRTTRGERSPLAKLTEANVVAIRERHASGEIQTDLAQEFSVSQAHVSAITLGKIWSHVEPRTGIYMSALGIE